MVYLEPELCWSPESCLLILRPVTAGTNNDGRLGLSDTFRRGDQGNQTGDFLPAVSLGTNLTATAIACGEDHACALLSNAQINCWGECHIPLFLLRWPGSRDEGVGPACVLAAVI